MRLQTSRMTPLVAWFHICLAALMLPGSLAYGQSEVRAEESVLPSALRALYQARQRINSGRVLWQVRDERWPAGEHLRYESQYARDGDLLFTHLGNEEGWTEFRKTFDPAKVVPKGKRKIRVLCDERGWWRYGEGRSHVEYAEAELVEKYNFADSAKEVRSVGVAPTPGSLNANRGLEYLWDCAGRPFARWQQQRLNDGRYEVIGTTAHGGEVVWEINPDRGWNAERIYHRYQGDIISEARCEIRKYGDVWLPAETRYYRQGDPHTTVRILDAVINQPSDSASFDLDALGIQPGTQFMMQTKDGPPSIEWQKENPGWNPIWNGDEITTLAQFMEDVRAGRREWGPLFQPGAEDPHAMPEEQRRQTMAEREFAADVRVKNVLSLWERYVRSFIEKYQLDESQRNTAMKILEQCQQMAWRVVKRQRPERTRLETKLEKAREEKNTKAHEKALKELRALLEPVNKIFEERLKPRLEKLPTRAQRTAAKEAEKAADAERSKVVDEINRAGDGG